MLASFKIMAHYISMQRPNQLVIVRHAESKRNEAKKGRRYFENELEREPFIGMPDHHVPLTKKGIKQAKQTGVGIREHFGTFDYVYNSGYRRTIDTMESVLAAYTKKERASMQIRQNEFIRERDPGYTYDMTKKEAKTLYPLLERHWDSFGGYMARPPGGESLSDVAARVYTFLGMIFRDRVDQKVLVFTHGGTIRGFRHHLEHWDYDQATNFNGEPHPLNCGVTTYDYSHEAGRLLLESYNQTYYDEELISIN